MSQSSTYIFPFSAERFSQVMIFDDEKDLARENVEFLRQLSLNTQVRKYQNFEEIMSKYPGAACGVVYRDTRPLFVGGYYLTKPDTYRIFVIPDMNVLVHPLAFHRMVKQICDWLRNRPWCNRIETVSLSVKRIDRWMKALGFVCEGDAFSYTKTGQTYKMWSR